jgi:hypothetical protein
VVSGLGEVAPVEQFQAHLDNGWFDDVARGVRFATTAASLARGCSGAAPTDEGYPYADRRLEHMAEKNTEWRYHHAEAGDVGGIDFDKSGRNGFELCGLASHNGKPVAVFKRNPTAKDEAGRAARRAQKGANVGGTADGGARGTRGR